ncbi:MAG: TIGR04086 family membrane protein [Anaerotruncus sp.]|nr:TIGR04086 family membrane protein [Anaerotruncus sp.]
MKQPDLHCAKRFIRPITYGIAAGAAVCVLLLLLMAAVMNFRDLPQAVIALFATVSFVGAGFTAGFVCAICSRERGLLLGLCCGSCMFILLAFFSLAFSEPTLGIGAASKLAAVLFAAALGGVIGVNKRKKFR